MSGLNAEQVKQANHLLEELARADETLEKLGTGEFTSWVTAQPNDDKSNDFSEVKVAIELAESAVREQRKNLLDILKKLGIEIA